MSNALTDLRKRLVEDLTAAGLNAHEVLPERTTVPVVWVIPGDPYISREGATFGGLIVRHQVNFAAAKGTNASAAEALDAMLLDVMDVLDGLEDFDAGDVERIGTAPINGQEHLAAGFNVATEIRR